MSGLALSGRDRKILVLAGVLVAVLAAWLLVIAPKRDQAAKLSDQVKSEQSQLSSARSQVLAGEAARHSFQSNYAQLARLGEAVPMDDNVPSLIYQVQSAASAAKVDFRTLALSTQNGSSSSATPPPSSSKSTSTKQSASPTQSATASLPPGATVGPAGLPVEPFTFTFRGNFFHLSDFLGRLERFVVATNRQVAVSGRLMTLNAISLGQAPRGFPQITATISATTYLVPSSQGLLGGATPSGPAGTSAQQVSAPASGGSSAPTPTSSSTPSTR